MGIHRYLHTSDRVEYTGGNRLNLDVCQNKPVLVVQMDEVLNGINITQCNRLLLPKALPVVERIAIVTQNRRTLEEQAGAAERDSEVGG